MNGQDQIEIRLLGPTLIRRRDGEVVSPKEWRTAKSLELVRLLALSEGRVVSTDVVLDRLWPSSPSKKAQASLRTATYHARLVLGEDAIERLADGLALRDAWTDVRAYSLVAGEIELARRARQHLTVAALSREAEALYVHDIDAESSGEWLLEAQQRFRAMRLEVLLAASESAVAVGRMAEALGLAGCASQLEPSSERAVRVTMRAHGALGEIEKALSAYDRLRTELADHYGADPAPQTRALHVELLVGTGDDGSCGPSTDLVGRDASVGELADALVRSQGAAGGVIWVVGERGTGRAAVIRAACERAGFSIRSTRMRVERIADQAAVQRTLQVGEVVVTPEASMLTADGALRLRDWATSHDVMLVVPTSGRNAAALRTAFGPLGTPEVVRVEPLTRSCVELLLKQLLQGDPAPALVHTVLARTGGRPGDIRRLVSDWLRRGVVMWAPEGLALEDDQGSAPLFPSPSDRLLKSLATLEFRAVEALAVVAVLAGPVVAGDVDAVLAAIHRRHPMDAERLLTVLADAGLLRVTVSGFHLRSSRDRGELFAWLRPAELRRIHGVVAHEVPMDPAAKVRHLMAAGQHQLACDLGVQALARKREEGDTDGILELTTVLEILPSRMVPAVARQRGAIRVDEPVGLLASA